ncbi:UNVERIFIED_CONTAM: hypothetical protein Slati_0881400 [Sesamum latifolium]|uniref:Endonuclease/exonuclease/phosphatase domain-containing protein n=1 Tax=Sesamum latifolium TaxID=2727402 RepID=A0AAW2XMZ6_9LAMI
MHTVCSSPLDLRLVGMYYYVALSASHGIASSYGLQSWRGCPHLIEHGGQDWTAHVYCVQEVKLSLTHTYSSSVNMRAHAFGFWKQRFGSDCQGLVGNTPSYGRLKDGEVNTRGMPFSVHSLPRWFITFGWNETSKDLGMNPLFRNLADSIDDEPLLVMGDFNTVADMSEVCGHSGDIRVAMEEFQDCISQTGIITLPMQGNLFTWHNHSTDSRSLWKRLDRMLANDRWLARWPDVSYSSLNAWTLDHSPLVIRGDVRRSPVRIFRFDNYLAASSQFIPTVQRIWGNSVVGTAMYSVTRKLKALKPLFRAQRKQKGDLSSNVKLAQEFLATVQNLLRQDRHDPLLLLLENCCRMVYLKAVLLEQQMLQHGRSCSG